MQDAPGLDIRDDSFDLLADLIDGFVVGLVVGVEGLMGCFSLGVIMASPIYPLSPIWCGGGVPSGRPMVETSSRPERRRAPASWTPLPWGRTPTLGSHLWDRRPGCSARLSCAYLKSSSE